MSYEIVYNRAFIKTSRGIIPLILTGSNNCYEVTFRGRERREREWSMFWGNKHVEIDAQDLLTFMADYGADVSNYEFCMFRGKWLYKKDAYDFYKQGIKNAHTIEEWIKNGRQHKTWGLGQLRCYISDWSGGYDKHFETLEKAISTTADLEAWIDDAKRYIHERKDIYMCFKWWTREPISYNEQKAIKGACCIKDGNRYLTEANNVSTSWSLKKNDALVFDNIEQAKAYIETHEGFKWHAYKIFNYTTNKKEPPKNCYIRIKGYGIFARFSRYGYRYSYALYDKLYMTEKRAVSVIEKLKRMFGDDREFELVKKEA